MAYLAVRPAKAEEADLLYVGRMFEELIKTTVFHDLPFQFDYGYMSELALSFLQEPNSTILIAEDEGKIVGAIVVQVCNHLFIPDVRYLYEHAFWVEPEYRKQHGPSALWKAACLWAKDKGCMGSVYGKPQFVGKNGHQKVIEHMVWKRWVK